MNWKSPVVRLVLILLLVGGGAVGVITWREYQRGVRIQNEIDGLRREADKIKRENEGLSEKIAYFSSPDFQEREAKEKLGFRRLEESVVILQGTPTPTKKEVASDEENRVEREKSRDMPNYRKWWNLFFPNS